MPNFMPIVGIVSEIWPVLIFSRCRSRWQPMADSCASTCQISCRLIKPLWRYGHFSFFSKWWQSAILDLLYAILDHQQRAYGGLCHCAKFGWIRYSSFNNICLNILHVSLAWKCLFTPLFVSVGSLNGERCAKNLVKISPEHPKITCLKCSLKTKPVTVHVCPS